MSDHGDWKTYLTGGIPLCQKGEASLFPLVSFSCRKQAKGGGEGFYKGISNS
jgi:hypothetical protein